MTFRLSSLSLERAIDHLCRYGDTDIFPHLPELSYVHAERSSIVDALSRLDLDSYDPGEAVEALAPKARYSFRITHQLCVIDNILLLASVVELGECIEDCRQSRRSVRAFSYRFSSEPQSNIFRDDHTYKNWIKAQKRIISEDPKINCVLSTDISDFYARINFHRLENLLDEVAANHGAARYIKKAIKIIRTRQSFGLPVGSAAARLLSELSMVDTDTALKDKRIRATRYVDDFRIFLKEPDEPYTALCFLAQQLCQNEGLNLNSSKTYLDDRDSYIGRLEGQSSDIEFQAETEALEALTAGIYEIDEPDPEDIERLKGINLLDYLERELEENDFDIGHIRLLFRALRITKPDDAIDYICENFSRLTIFSKDLVLLIEELHGENPGCFDRLRGEVISHILRPPASSVQLIRTWLLELFVKDVIQIDKSQLSRFDNFSTVFDKKQLFLIRGRLGDKNYFRQHKGSLRQLSIFEQMTFVAGATCLPKDEFERWLPTPKRVMSIPTSDIFLSWVKREREEVIGKFSGI